METNYIDVDALSPPTPPTSNETVHVSLRIKLTLPYGSEVGMGNNIQGLNGAVSFVTPIPPNAKVLTQVTVDGVCLSKEAAAFGVIETQAGPQSQDPTRPQEQRYVAVLPDSWLTRCRWMQSGSKRTLVIQTVVVDGETLFVVIYDLERVRDSLYGQVPRAELVLWHKKFGTTPPRSPALLPLPMSSPSSSRFGDHSNAANAYLYSTAASLQSQAHHVHPHAPTPIPAHHHSSQLQHAFHPLQTQASSSLYSQHGGSALGNSPISPLSANYGTSGSLRGKSCAASSTTVHGSGMFPTSSGPWTPSLMPLF